MLSRLKVANLAIVERAEIKFGSGLNVITGETGSGKSVLMGALDLVLGGRAEAEQVRDGAAEAEVEAMFDTTCVRRTVTREGRSRAWINDESVSISELREFGHSLVDIHGPRANQKLLDEGFQRETLDAFGSVTRESYETAYRRLMALRSEEAALKNAGGEDELELLCFQVNELNEADLVEEDETLAERHAAAAHAEEIVENANAITEALGGDRGATEILISLHPKFSATAKHFPAAESWRAEVEDLTVRLQELSRTIADAISRLDVGEEDLASLDSRLTLINRLKRKYRVGDVASLINLRDEKQSRLALLEGRDEKLAALEGQIRAAEEDVRQAGAALSKVRAKVAAKLAKAITGELKALGFLQAKFSVTLEPVEPGPTGLDRVVYLFEPNPGEAARPLAAIASSGEIARVMLALKVVLVATTPTLVFDEIDANIGGEVGKVVGEKMREVAAARQVIAITHLPQSAVYGDHHFVVSKSVSEGRTRTGVFEAKGKDRVAEIARMLGGEKLTSVVKRHAEELLELSR